MADVRFAAHWGGFIGLNLNMLPALGTAGTHNNIHYGIGYGGHGLAQATLMGSVLSDAITGADNEWDRVLRRWNPSWPIEPIRWLTYNGVSKRLGRSTGEPMPRSSTAENTENEPRPDHKDSMRAPLSIAKRSHSDSANSHNATHIHATNHEDRAAPRPLPSAR